MSNEIKGTVSTTGAVKGSLNVVYGAEGDSAYEVAVMNGFEGTEKEWLASLKGDKGDKGDTGNSGVYLGSGEMPDDCNVQIDPNGDADFSVDQTYSPTSKNPQSGIAIAEAMENVSNALKRSVSGEIVQITDASPLPHLATVTVDGADQAYLTGRNLFDGVYEDVIMSGAVNPGLVRKTLDFLPAGKYMFSFSPSIYWQSPRGDGYGINTVNSTIKRADDGGILSVVVDITDPSIALIQFRCHDTATYPVPKDVVRMQIEFGETLTEYTPYVEPIVVPSGGSVQLPQGVATVYAKDAVVTCEYNRDINAAFQELTQAIINLGGTVGIVTQEQANQIASECPAPSSEEGEL